MGDSTRHGMLLGKFLPPHLGHVYLAQFAERYADSLDIVVCTLEREPIPGDLRYEWMSRLFPDANVVHLDEELPQTPDDHPDFWELWDEALRGVLETVPDLVFASEDYGAPLADLFEARFVPVDPAREAVPVSGTDIRANPLDHWEYLPVCVRPYFVRRVCLFGPESTGKTTLARRLADHFETVWVPEYARTLIELTDGEVDHDDMLRIARGQCASEDALAEQANRLLFCDTDPLLTTIWSDVLFGDCADSILRRAERRSYDLYLLLDADVPWVDDVARFTPDQRADFFGRCREALDHRARPYRIIRGGWEERFGRAVEAVEQLLA